MFKLFNKIRMKTIAENKLGRYLKYAIGEIILVVIGILIALQINNWNIERNNNLQETQILKQLQKEFEANLTELNGKISMRNDMIYATERIVEIFEKGIQNTPLDTLLDYNMKLYLTPTFNASTGVTDELLSSGKLYLIRNQELKTYLTNWSGDIEKLVEMEMTLYDLSTDEIIPYIIKNFKRKNLIKSKASQEIHKKFMMGDAKEPNFRGVLKKEEFEKFYRDNVMENFAITVGDFAYYGNRQSSGIKKRIEDILSIIQEELNSKNYD